MAQSVRKNVTQDKDRNVYFALITVVVSSIFCLFVIEYALSAYQKQIENSSQSDPGLLRHHSQRGWTLTPGWKGRHRHHDFDSEYEVNQYGFRGAFPNRHSPNKKPRIAIVGDSFSFGIGVNEKQTFTAQLNQRQTKIEFVNLSVPGYSTDQQLLLLDTYISVVNADEYILMIYLGNDLLDNMLSYPLQLEHAKPYFSLEENDSIVLRNVPVPQELKPARLHNRTLDSVVFGDDLPSHPGKSIVGKSQILKRLIPVKASVEKTIVFEILDKRLVQHKALMSALLTALKDKVHENNATLRLGILPGRSYIVAPESYSSYFQEYCRLFLKENAKQLKIPVIDIADDMRAIASADSPIWYFPNEGHLNHQGHKIVSEILLKSLEPDE